MPLKNAFSRAIFGYKRQKSDSFQISNNGRSPATKMALKKYDKLRSRGNGDALLLPIELELEQGARNGATAHKSASKSEVELLPSSSQPCNEPLSESTINKTRPICENDCRDLKEWHSSSGRSRNRFDESCTRDVAVESQVINDDCKIFNEGVRDESGMKSFEAWTPSPVKPASPFGLSRQGDPAESPVLTQHQKPGPFVVSQHRNTSIDKTPKTENHRKSSVRSRNEGEKDLQLLHARSPIPLVSSDGNNPAENQIVNNNIHATSTDRGLSCDDDHLDFPVLNEHDNPRWSREKEMQDFKKCFYPAPMHLLVGSRQRDGNTRQGNLAGSPNPSASSSHGDSPPGSKTISNGNNQLTSDGIEMNCADDHLNFHSKSNWETNPFNACDRWDTSFHYESGEPKASFVGSYPKHLGICLATVERANVNKNTKQKPNDNSVQAFGVGISRRRDDVTAEKLQTSGSKRMLPDAKKIIPHVLPIPPTKDMSPLPLAALAPSPLRSKLPPPLKSRLPSPLRSRVPSPLRSRAPSPSKVPALLMPESTMPDLPILGTYLPLLDPPASSSSQVLPSKAADSSASLSFFVVTGLANTSTAPVPSRIDAPPRRAQRRGSGRKSLTSAFLNQDRTARQSKSVERRSSSFEVLFEKIEPTTEIRQQGMSELLTTQDFIAIQQPNPQSSEKYSRTYKQCSSSPVPLSQGLMFHELKGRSVVQNAILEFDRLAERKSCNRFVDAPGASPERQQICEHMAKPPSCTGPKLNVLEPTLQKPVREFKSGASPRLTSPRKMHCFSEDLGNTVAAGWAADKQQGATLKSEESSDVTARGLGVACCIPDLPESSLLNSADSSEASACWLGSSFGANRTPGSPLSFPLMSTGSCVQSRRSEQIQGYNLFTLEGCFSADLAALDGLGADEPELLTPSEMLMKATLLEPRRVLNIDDPSRCTFWVSDGSCQHLEMDVNNVQPVVLDKDSPLAKKEKLTPTGTSGCSLKTVGQISLEDALERSTFSKSCTAPSKKTSRRRRIKASLSFRSNSSSKNRIRHNFSFSSVR